MAQQYINESHPARVRGLKLKQRKDSYQLTLSHPARVRGLKLDYQGGSHDEKSRTPRGCVD